MSVKATLITEGQDTVFLTDYTIITMDITCVFL